LADAHPRTPAHGQDAGGLSAVDPRRSSGLAPRFAGTGGVRGFPNRGNAAVHRCELGLRAFDARVRPGSPERDRPRSNATASIGASTAGLVAPFSKDERRLTGPSSPTRVGRLRSIRCRCQPNLHERPQFSVSGPSIANVEFTVSSPSRSLRRSAWRRVADRSRRCIDRCVVPAGEVGRTTADHSRGLARPTHRRHPSPRVRRSEAAGQTGCSSAYSTSACSTARIVAAGN
jgi:hypothetical protein